LAPLRGSSRVSLGAHDELLEVGARLRQAGVEPSAFQAMSAGDALAALKGRPDAVGVAVRAYLDAIGMRLAGGYDVGDPCAIELPEMMLGTIWASREAIGRPAAGGNGVTAKARDAVPAAHRAAFDELLDDARLINRLR